LQEFHTDSKATVNQHLTRCRTSRTKTDRQTSNRRTQKTVTRHCRAMQLWATISPQNRGQSHTDNAIYSTPHSGNVHLTTEQVQ